MWLPPVFILGFSRPWSKIWLWWLGTQSTCFKYKRQPYETPVFQTIMIMKMSAVTVTGTFLNSSNPKIKIEILICCPYTFPIEISGRWSRLLKKISSKIILCDAVLNSRIIHPYSYLSGITCTFQTEHFFMLQTSINMYLLYLHCRLLNFNHFGAYMYISIHFALFNHCIYLVDSSKHYLTFYAP